MNLLKHTGLALILLGMAGCFSDAWAKGDSTGLVCTSISTEKLMLLKTTWSESANAAALSGYECKNGVAKAWLGYQNETGGFRLFQEPDEKNRFGFYTNGYSAIGKWKFYGHFNYYNETSQGVRWSDVMEPYNGNPYTVGDSVGGDYWREYYVMEGRSSLSLSSRLSVGIDVKYKGGVGTKRKDPRPENTITDFEFSPAVIWKAGKSGIGASLRLETGKEDIEFTSVTGTKFDLFYFRGLGAFSATMDDDGRYSKTTLLGGGLQYNYNGNIFENLTEVQFNRQRTDIKRGDVYPLQVVFLDNYMTEISSQFLFNPGGKDISRFRFLFSHGKIYGEEPVVEPKLEEVTWQWSTAAKYTLYWQTMRNFSAGYSFFRVKDRHHFNWGATLNGKYSTDEVTYYFIPEFNRQKINLLTFDASLEKNLLSGRNQLVLVLNGEYRFSPSDQLIMVDDALLLKNIQSEFVTHDFQYRMSDILTAGVNIDYGRELKFSKASVQFFLEAGYRSTSANFQDRTKRNMFHINAGINF